MPSGENLKGNPNIGNTFSKDNQPTSKAKKDGWAKKRLMKEFFKTIVSGDLKDTVTPLANKLDIDIELVTVEMAMHMAQISKAILEGDTMSYKTVMERINGKIVDKVEVKDTSDNKPISITFHGKSKNKQ